MLQANRLKPQNLSISEMNSIEFMESEEVDFALLSTTKTMKNKKITDAIKKVREYLERSGYHNYNEQDFGSKISKSVNYITESKSYLSEGSFYRANERGDQRLNLSGVWEHSEENEVMFLVVKEDILNVINISKNNLKDIWNDKKNSNIKEFLKSILEQKTIPIFDDFEIDNIDIPEQKAIEGALKELKVLVI